MTIRDFISAAQIMIRRPARRPRRHRKPSTKWVLRPLPLQRRVRTFRTGSGFVYRGTMTRRRAQRNRRSADRSVRVETLA